MAYSVRKFVWRTVFPLFCLFAVLVPASGQSGLQGSSSAHTRGTTLVAPLYAQKLQNGVNLYREGRWHEALYELLVAQDEALNDQQLSEAVYWIALTQLAAGYLDAALKTMSTVTGVGGERSIDIEYHRGTAHYYLGNYDEAIDAFKDYTEKAAPINRVRIAAAYYWMGESYATLGQTEQAKENFQIVVDKYRGSAKYDASAYRLLLLNQKKVEQELLEMLRWSHEESIKTSEEFQRRERMYDQALIAYQRQLAEYQQLNLHTEVESAAEYRRQLAEAQDRISLLEEQLGISDPSQAGGPEDMMSWATQLRKTMYDMLQQRSDISILYNLSDSLDRYINGETTLSEEELAAMELTVTLLKGQYNLTL